MDSNFQREPIYGALFTRLLGAIVKPIKEENGSLWISAGPPTKVAPFRAASRRYRPAGELGVEQYPAFFMVERGEIFERSVVFGPAKVTLVAHIIIQSLIGEDPNVVSATEANNLADAVQAVAEPDLGDVEKFTLGGSAFIAWITGRQTVTISSGQARWDVQEMECEIIATH